MRSRVVLLGGSARATRGASGRAVALLASFLLTLSSARTSHADEATPLALHPTLVGGAIAIAQDTKTSVALCEGDTFYNCKLTCGGTLVAPNLIVTSRHCADVLQVDSLDCSTYRFSGKLKAPSTIWVTVASPVSNDASFHEGLKWDLPRAIGCGHDLAFLTLKDAVPADQSPPVAPATAHDSVTALGSDLLTIYGYGRTGPNAPIDPERRSLKAKVLCVGGRDSCKTIASGESLLDTEFAIDAQVCPGDSGSGAFSPSGALLGSLARSIGGTGTCAYGVYTRLAPHGLLLARTATAAAVMGGYPAPSWVEPLQRAGNSPLVSPRAFGAPCDDGADCDSGECRSFDEGLAWSCAKKCDGSCGAPCRHTAEGDYCFAEPEPPHDESCQFAPTRRDPLPWAIALSCGFAAAAFVRRRRRS